MGGSLDSLDELLKDTLSLLWFRVASESSYSEDLSNGVSESSSYFDSLGEERRLNSLPVYSRWNFDSVETGKTMGLEWSLFHSLFSSSLTFSLTNISSPAPSN